MNEFSKQTNVYPQFLVGIHITGIPHSQHVQVMSPQSMKILTLRPHNDDGMLPLKLLCQRYNSESSVKRPNSVGIVPVKVLEERYRNESSVKTPNSVGMLPLKVFS